MLEQLRIRFLKWRARMAVKAYRRARARIPGGAAISATVSAEVRFSARKVNRLLDQLARLDPTALTARLPEGL